MQRTKRLRNQAKSGSYNIDWGAILWPSLGAEETTEEELHKCPWILQRTMGVLYFRNWGKQAVKPSQSLKPGWPAQSQNGLVRCPDTNACKEAKVNPLCKKMASLGAPDCFYFSYTMSSRQSKLSGMQATLPPSPVKTDPQRPRASLSWDCYFRMATRRLEEECACVESICSRLYLAWAQALQLKSSNLGMVTSV